MALEIERKFLVHKHLWDVYEKGVGEYTYQGYLSTDPNSCVRIRLNTYSAKIAIKGQTNNITRKEYEYDIPHHDGIIMLETMCKYKLSKIRYKFFYMTKFWDVDVFLNENSGLIIAEVELNSENETFELPPFIDKEVSDDVRYYNLNLAINPYNTW